MSGNIAKGFDNGSVPPRVKLPDVKVLLSGYRAITW
jgi:hypothetical protein